MPPPRTRPQRTRAQQGIETLCSDGEHWSGGTVRPESLSCQCSRLTAVRAITVVSPLAELVNKNASKSRKERKMYLDHLTRPRAPSREEKASARKHLAPLRTQPLGGGDLRTTTCDTPHTTPVCLVHLKRHDRPHEDSQRGPFRTLLRSVRCPGNKQTPSCLYILLCRGRYRDIDAVCTSRVSSALRVYLAGRRSPTRTEARSLGVPPQAKQTNLPRSFPVDVTTVRMICTRTT